MRRFTALLLAATLIQVGCNNDGKHAVTGTVTFNGDVVPEGRVVFMPEDESLAPDGGPIVDGRFQFRSLAGGKRVEIYADRDVGEPDPVMNIVRREQYIPVRFNEKSELSANVDPKGKNEFSFELVAEEGEKGAGM